MGDSWSIDVLTSSSGAGQHAKETIIILTYITFRTSSQTDDRLIGQLKCCGRTAVNCSNDRRILAVIDSFQSAMHVDIKYCAYVSDDGSEPREYRNVDRSINYRTGSWIKHWQSSYWADDFHAIMLSRRVKNWNCKQVSRFKVWMQKTIFSYIQG